MILDPVNFAVAQNIKRLREKQKLSMDGHYVMTENGPTWKAQADAVGRYVIEHQKVSGLANQDGYATGAF